MRISNDINKERIKEFLIKHLKSNIFQTPEMLEVYKETNKYEPVFLSAIDEEDNVLGSLLAVIQKEHKGFLGKFSARSIIWGAPIIKENNPDVLDFILKEYNKSIKNKAIYTQFRNLWNWNSEEKKIFEKNGFIYEDHLDVLIDLNKDPEKLFMNIHKGRRKNIRRAERLPLEFIEIYNDRDFVTCVSLIEKTYKRIGLPYPDKSFFINAKNFLSKSLKMFVAKYNNEIIACRFVLCYKEIIYDWYAGAADDHLDKYPNDFLPYKVMEWGIENGYKIFDFGGAGKPNIPYGVRDFKMKYGGKLVNWGRFEKVHNPLLMKVGQLGMAIYKMLR